MTPSLVSCEFGEFVKAFWFLWFHWPCVSFLNPLTFACCVEDKFKLHIGDLLVEDWSNGGGFHVAGSFVVDDEKHRELSTSLACLRVLELL